MTTEQYPKVYLYKRIVQAKVFIDTNYADNIDLDNISDEAYFFKIPFHQAFQTNLWQDTAPISDCCEN